MKTFGEAIFMSLEELRPYVQAWVNKTFGDSSITCAIGLADNEGADYTGVMLYGLDSSLHRDAFNALYERLDPNKEYEVEADWPQTPEQECLIPETISLKIIAEATSEFGTEMCHPTADGIFLFPKEELADDGEKGWQWYTDESDNYTCVRELRPGKVYEVLHVCTKNATYLHQAIYLDDYSDERLDRILRSGFGEESLEGYLMDCAACDDLLRAAGEISKRPDSTIDRENSQVWMHYAYSIAARIAEAMPLDDIPEEEAQYLANKVLGEPSCHIQTAEEESAALSTIPQSLMDALENAAAMAGYEVLDVTAGTLCVRDKADDADYNIHISKICN